VQAWGAHPLVLHERLDVRPDVPDLVDPQIRQPHHRPPDLVVRANVLRASCKCRAHTLQHEEGSLGHRLSPKLAEAHVYAVKEEAVASRGSNS